MGVVGRLDQYASMLAGEFDDYSMSENLVSYSTYNSSTWGSYFPANATITTGISAPDGTSTAIRFTCTATGSSLLRVLFPAFTPNGTDTYTSSFYVRLISGTTGGLSSDLNDGAPNGSYLSSLVSNQWVRVSFSGVPTATSKSFIDLLSDSTNNYVLDFWGVQVEKGSVATDYTPTIGAIISRILPATTNTNITGLGTYYSSGFDENTSITTLVQTGENLFPWSETFTVGNGWGGGGTINLDSSIVDPIGNTGTVYYPTLSEWVREFNGLGATTITLSFFTKVRSGSGGNTTYIQMYQETAIGEPSNVGAYNFDMVGSNSDSGRFTNITRTQYPNEWYRFTCKVTSNASAGSGTFTSTSRVDLEGFQTTNYIWGIQVERGSVATDYIRTTGVSRSRSLPSPIFALSANVFAPYDHVYDEFGGTLFGAGQGRYMRQNTDKSVIVYNEIDEITSFTSSNDISFWLLGEQDSASIVTGGTEYTSGGTFTSANITATSAGSTTLSFTFIESGLNCIQGSTSYIRLYKNSSQIFEFTRSSGLTTTYSASYSSGDVFYFQTELFVSSGGGAVDGTIQVIIESSLVYSYYLVNIND